MELVLSGYDSTSSIPKRALEGEPTELQHTVPAASPLAEESLTESPKQPSFTEGVSSDTVIPQTVDRPNRLPLPTRKFSVSESTSTSPLPSPSSSDAHHAPSTSLHVPPAEMARQVLVVDDDSLTRMLMKRMLTRMGCTVDTAENGELALEMITGEPRRPSSSLTSEPGLPALKPNGEGKYAVVFLDNQMPIMSGLEAVAKLRELGRRDLVVGITGTIHIVAIDVTAI